MAVININGHWAFVLVYGPEYEEDAGKEIYFDAEFIQDNDTFSGTGIDTGGHGINPDPAIINGFLDGDEISFVKQYASKHYTGENGEIIVEKNIPGPEINYFGTYNKRDNTFNGDWDIVIGTEQVGGSWFDYSCTGTWYMKRK